VCATTAYQYVATAGARKFTDNKCKVLLCAHTNRAVDDLCEKVAVTSARVLRVYAPSAEIGASAKMLDYSLHAILNGKAQKCEQTAWAFKAVSKILYKKRLIFLCFVFH
jgi:hypothetical protein